MIWYLNGTFPIKQSRGLLIQGLHYYLYRSWLGNHTQTDTVNVLKDRKNMKRSRLIGENLDGTSNIGPDMQQTHEPWPSRYP
jgi:hypothetical protein